MTTALLFPATLLALLLIICTAWRVRSWPCPAWLRWLVEIDAPIFKTARAAQIIEHLAIQPGMTILDAGCGPGRLTLPLAQKTGPTGAVTALDIQDKMLARVRHKAGTSGLTNIEYLPAALGTGALAGRASTFDRALLVTVLGEIPRPQTQNALDEIYAALKPGGILSITELILDPHYQPRRKVTRLARASGFQEKTRSGNALAYTITFEKVQIPPTLSVESPKQLQIETAVSAKVAKLPTLPADSANTVRQIQDTICH
jgi:ubiquinone/menaquinone biosynthesis C-methylase UbiE